MIPHEEGGKAVGKERKTEVPMKVIPQAQISPKHKLSPTQRLHIEHLTRHPPKQQTSKGRRKCIRKLAMLTVSVYKERLLIYHYGIGRVNWMVFIRVSAIIAVCFMTVIWAPAYFNYGTPWYYVGAGELLRIIDVAELTFALVYLASFIPITFIGWATRSIATEIWLRLPVVARQSPQAAMAYAKNLPRDAIIELRFMRWTGHTGTIPVNVVDTTPVTSRWRIKPASFKWIGPRVDAGTALRPNPTEFFVRPTSAEGRAVRDTIPGLWSAVYKRLTGVDSSAVSKWKS